jgi:hypothetical protein
MGLQNPPIIIYTQLVVLVLVLLDAVYGLMVWSHLYNVRTARDHSVELVASNKHQTASPL